MTNFVANDRLQWSINRLNNDLAHLKSNCEICCLYCNQMLGGFERQQNKER